MPAVNRQIERLPWTDDEGARSNRTAPADEGKRTDLTVWSTNRNHLGWTLRFGHGHFYRHRLLFQRGRTTRRDRNGSFDFAIRARDFHGRLEKVVAGVELEGRRVGGVAGGIRRPSGNVSRRRGLRGDMGSGDQNHREQCRRLAQRRDTVEHGISPFASQPDHEDASRWRCADDPLRIHQPGRRAVRAVQADEPVRAGWFVSNVRSLPSVTKLSTGFRLSQNRSYRSSVPTPSHNSGHRQTSMPLGIITAKSKARITRIAFASLAALFCRTIGMATKDVRFFLAPMPRLARQRNRTPSGGTKIPS